MSGIIGGAGSRSGVIGTTELDYEEGTWTPTVSGTTSGSGDVGTGTYIKVGKVVTIIYYASNATFPTYEGTLKISLPFSGSSGGRQRGPDCFYYPNSAWDGWTNFLGIVPNINISLDYMFFSIKEMDGDRQDSISSSNSSTSAASGLYLQFSMNYIAA
jgi:hypothetical protein